MNPGEKEENIIILNPLWTVNPEGSLCVDPNRESFSTAMDYIGRNRTRIGTIMMLVDVPPRIQHAEQLFKTRSEARNKTRRHLGMRHLGQFSPWIQDHYLNYLPDSVGVDDIRILTETFVRNIVVSLPEKCRARLPKCRNTETCELPNGKKSAGCLEITIASLLFALDPKRYQENGNIFSVVDTPTTNQLHVFAQLSNRLPGEYVVEGVNHLPEGSVKYQITKIPTK